MNNDLNSLSEDEKKESEIQESAEKVQVNHPETTNDVTSELDNAVAETAAEVVAEETTPRKTEELDETLSSVNSQEDLDDDDSENDTTEVIDDVDHHSLTKEELVIRLKHILDVIPVSSRNLKDEVEKIKNAFYEKHQHEVDLTHEKYIADGGEEKDFKMPLDPQEQLLSELAHDYKKKRYELIKSLEAEKEINLLAKQDVIAGIKELIQSEESIHTTFNSFKDLQKRWREIGPVQQSRMRNLYESYHHSIEMFYDYIKINKELRDLDLKKNLEAKEHLCNLANELLKEESALDAFNSLQDLHKEWREIGPVPLDQKETLWERFKTITTEINKKHQQYYDDLKQAQVVNLDAKTVLCEKVEAIAQENFDKPKVWNKKSEEIVSIQNEWRTIGFAPRKFNNKIYERFRKACDEFFDKKRNFYQVYKKVQDDNLALKKALIEKAEALKESDDWKKTTNEFVKIQREWKNIGPVPRKQSDDIWNKFRASCDHFFKRKKDFFKDIDKVYDDNLKLKQQLIAEIIAYEPIEDNKAYLNKLHEFKQRWNDIGHVPFKSKDSIYNDFRNALNRHFDKLNMDESKREMEKFRSKVDDFQNTNNSTDKIVFERNKLLNKFKAMESEISVWENNIGFLSTNNKTNTLVKEYERKIETAKEHLQVLKRKIDLLNDSI